MVDHATGTLRASWARLAAPIAKPSKPAPRATAVRYMAELERLGMFQLTARGKPGRGERFNTWNFMWQCSANDEDQAANVPRPPVGVEHCEPSDASANVPKNPINVPFSAINVPRPGAKEQTGYRESMKEEHEPPFEEKLDPQGTATQKPNGEDHTPTSNDDNAKDRALDELRRMFGLGKPR